MYVHPGAVSQSILTLTCVICPVIYIYWTAITVDSHKWSFKRLIKTPLSTTTIVFFNSALLAALPIAFTLFSHPQPPLLAPLPSFFSSLSLAILFCLSPAPLFLFFVPPFSPFLPIPHFHLTCPSITCSFPPISIFIFYLPVSVLPSPSYHCSDIVWNTSKDWCCVQECALPKRHKCTCTTCTTATYAPATCKSAETLWAGLQCT